MGNTHLSFWPWLSIESQGIPELLSRPGHSLLCKATWLCCRRLCHGTAHARLFTFAYKPVTPRGHGWIQLFPEAQAFIPQARHREGENIWLLSQWTASGNIDSAFLGICKLYKASWLWRKHTTYSSGQLSKKDTVRGTRWTAADVRVLVAITASSTLPKQMSHSAATADWDIFADHWMRFNVTNGRTWFTEPVYQIVLLTGKTRCAFRLLKFYVVLNKS